MKKRRVVRWVLLAFLLALIVWVAVSENSCAQGARQLLGRKPDQAVLNGSFQIAAHSFRYYKFTLPEGSKNMALVGSFRIVPGDASAPAGQNQGKPSKAAVEVYVLNESDLDNWLKGNAASAIYQSGRVSEQKVERTLPAGSGVYYLVFSNKFDPASAKKVSAALALHSNRWFSY